MEQELVEIVIQKSFIELSNDERIELSEWCTSEEEYDQLKNVFLEVERMKVKQTASVRPETKKSLDAIFSEKHHKAPVFWNNSVMTLIYPLEKPPHKRPLIQVAAVALLFLFAYPIINNNSVSPAKQLAHNEIPEKKQGKGTDMSKMILENKEEASKKEVAKNKVHQPILTASNDFSSSYKTSKNPLVGADDLNSANLTYGFTTSTANTSPSISSSSVVQQWGRTDAVLIDGDHPDGLFEGEVISVFSESVDEDPEVLDLLTVTF